MKAGPGWVCVTARRRATVAPIGDMLEGQSGGRQGRSRRREPDRIGRRITVSGLNIRWYGAGTDLPTDLAAAIAGTTARTRVGPAS